LITPDMSLLETALLIAVMVGVSAVFWIVFIETLHLPAVRNRLDGSRVALIRAFGIVLIAFGARVAMLK
jgi:threonine/homoserine/homoserine lactone efflux protein